MANNFKTDDSFLKKLAVGAAGTNATIQRLKDLGFNPIELERGSTGFKIWKKIKIKRVRVPDILCLNTGLRFESRGKTKLEISMSHSLKDPKRTWDAGMRDDDMVSIIAFEQNDIDPINLKRISPVHFVSVKDMRDSFLKNQVSITVPKGVEEGSEIRVIWTSATTNYESKIIEVDSEKISMMSILTFKKQTIKLNRNGGRKIILQPQVKKDDITEQNQIVASVVPIHIKLTCPDAVNEEYFIEKLKSVNLSERYASAKALRYRGYTSEAETILKNRMDDTEEDIYVQLEAAAALAVNNDIMAWKFLENKIRSSLMSVPLETQLETIIVLSEITNEKSENLLIEVLKDNTRDEELRSGAAWALGQFPSANTASALVETFDLTTLDIKVEAARALLRIGELQKDHLISLLKSITPSKRDGLSWALARIGNFDPNELIENDDADLRKWASYIIGFGKDNFDQSLIENICKSDPEVYFAASVLWQLLKSWIHELKVQ